jgi:glycosyltransferase involved in cell wall biosynthesis
MLLLFSGLKLENQIHFIGFVDSKEIPIIYKKSIALVMPTFFGPTNITPLEAFDLGVPVLYSST